MGNCFSGYSENKEKGYQKIDTSKSTVETTDLQNLLQSLNKDLENVVLDIIRELIQYAENGDCDLGDKQLAFDRKYKELEPKILSYENRINKPDALMKFGDFLARLRQAIADITLDGVKIRYSIPGDGRSEEVFASLFQGHDPKRAHDDNKLHKYLLGKDDDLRKYLRR